mgnify:CR=1 FL=1
MYDLAGRAAHDVAVVGFGPVGAALANLLGVRGISCVVLEREGAAYHLPRAVHFDDEVMRGKGEMPLALAVAVRGDDDVGAALAYLLQAALPVAEGFETHGQAELREQLAHQGRRQPTQLAARNPGHRRVGGVATGDQLTRMGLQRTDGEQERHQQALHARAGAAGLKR